VHQVGFSLQDNNRDALSTEHRTLQFSLYVFLLRPLWVVISAAAVYLTRNFS